MYKKNIGLLVFAVFSQCSLLVAQVGQVGINTLTPQGTFHIDVKGNTNGMNNADDDVIVTSDGKVGIGTLKPDHLLTVKDDIAMGEYVTNTPVVGAGPKLQFLGKQNNSDYMYLYRYNRSEKEGNLFVNIGDQLDAWPGSTVPDYFVVGTTSKTTGAFRQLFSVRSNGSVGVARSLDFNAMANNKNSSREYNPSLEVYGTIHVRGNVKVGRKANASRSVGTSMSLDDLKKYIETNKHLPNMPTADVMKNEGVDLADLFLQMQHMIKQLSAYTKDQYNEILQIDSLLDVQSAKIETLKKSRSY